MKRFQTTICLTVILAMICVWRAYQWQQRKSTARQGFSIALSYPCFYPESFNVLGDDRQIVVRYKADKKLFVNETPFSESDVGSEMEKIFETRNEKLVWLEVAPQVTYGEALQTIASLHPEKMKATIAMSTESQLASKALDSHGFPVEYCPYQLRQQNR